MTRRALVPMSKPRHPDALTSTIHSLNPSNFLVQVALQKLVQSLSAGSKHEVREWIASGRVSVDGMVVTRFAEPVDADAVIEIDGQRLVRDRPPRVILMHKPKKHVTARVDPEGRDALEPYLPGDSEDLFAVGRLDYNTEGALLWTNDGLLARRILHPDSHFPKRYRVKIRGHLHEGDPGLAQMRAGMTVGGVEYRPASVRIDVHRTRATWVELILTEGKHREIRRMCHACRFQIVKLRREAVGPVELGELNPRCTRELTEAEMNALYEMAGLPRPATVDRSVRELDEPSR